MPIEIDGAPPGLPPRRWVRIASIDKVTPRVRRLRLQGEDLAGFEIPAPGAHVKLILPPPGDRKPAVPLRYEDRRAVFEEGVQPPVLRTYTPLRFDPAQLELVVDLLVHGDGMASQWVERAEVGDEIVVAGPRGGWTVPQDGAWYLVAADETALPAAEQVLAALPKGAACTVLFEVADAAEERTIPDHDPAPAQWLPRGDSHPGRPLEDAIANLDLGDGRGYAWVACEASAMRRIRAGLVARGLSSDQLVTRGYWKLGAADHPDGDYGQDDLGHGH